MGQYQNATNRNKTGFLLASHREEKAETGKLKESKIQHSQFKIISVAGSVKFLSRLENRFRAESSTGAVPGEQGLEFAIGRIEAALKSLKFRVYRPVLPLLTCAVGEGCAQASPPRISRTSHRASSSAAFTPPLIFRNRNARRGPLVQNPAERIRFRSSGVWILATSHALRLWITSVI